MGKIYQYQIWLKSLPSFGRVQTPDLLDIIAKIPQRHLVSTVAAIPRDLNHCRVFFDYIPFTFTLLTISCVFPPSIYSLV